MFKSLLTKIVINKISNDKFSGLVFQNNLKSMRNYLLSTSFGIPFLKNPTLQSCMDAYSI